MMALNPALLSPIQDKIKHSNQSQNYNSEWSVEVWEKVMLILEKNWEIELKLNLKIEAANSYQTSRHLLPSLWYNDSHEHT